MALEFLWFTLCCAIWCTSLGGAEVQIETNRTLLRKVKDGSDILAQKRPRQMTKNDIADDLRHWTPPKFFIENYPAYLSGFDDEDRPIWISEFGKMDLRKTLSRGPAGFDELDEYILYAARTIIDSFVLKNPEGNTGAFILDFDGLQLGQFASPTLMRYLLKLAQEWGGMLEEHAEVIVIINANYLTETLINLVKPVIGRLIGRAEVYGLEKSKWIPQLLRHFPAESLPEWYGGRSGFKPLAVLGQ